MKRVASRSPTHGRVKVLTRPRGVRPRDKAPPQKHDPSRIVSVLVGSNYQVAARLWLQDGYEFTSRVIVDTGSAASLIRQDLLPEGTDVSPAGSPEWRMFDVNGGLLPIVGSIALTVCIGFYQTQVNFGVVSNMSVPVLLGTDYLDLHVPAVCGPEGIIRMRNGETVPILRKGRTVSPTTHQPRENSPKGGGSTTHVRVCKGTVVPPRSRTFVRVRTRFRGNGLVSPVDRVYYTHQVQVAWGPMTCGDDQTWWVEVLNTSEEPRRLPGGMKIASISTFEGNVVAVTQQQWEDIGMAGSADQSSSSTAKSPTVHRENIPECLHGRLDELIQKHHKLWNGDLGLIKATEHRIVLKPGARPVRLSPYRMGPDSRELTREQVQRMQDMGVIEPCSSEWASPIVLVPKSDGTMRFCIDYRKLNERTVRDSYPLPRMDDCLDSLGEAQYFSTLDCNAGYWQIPIRKEDRHLTTFTCHCGVYQCTRLPFGLCNAPATFQRAIDLILAGVKWQIALVYLDDIIVFSGTAEEHLSHLDRVFTLLGEAGVTLKPTKCHLFSNEVEYLGHIVRPGRILVNEKNLMAIRRAKFPQTQTQLRSFLGMCNVYRRFVANYAKVSAPLNHLVSSKMPKRLDAPKPPEQEAFDRLRELLCNPPVLAIPRPGAHYIVDVDASYDQLGCCLLQQQPSGEYLPVGYFSKGLSPAQKNYSVTEVEGLGVVWAVSMLRPYIEGRKFLIRCDHKALKWILTTTACTNNRLNRWRLCLAEFDYDVEYRPGPKHAVADALSRIPTDGKDTSPIPEELPHVAVTTRSGTVLDPRMPGMAKLLPVSLDEFVQAQESDKLCRRLRKELDQAQPTRFFLNDNGILCRKGYTQGDKQVVVPKELRKSILQREHSSPLGGHPGSTRMYQTLRKKYYWPSLVADVYGYVAACATCAKNRLMESRQTSSMRLFPATEPFAAIAVDLLGPLPRTPEGYEYLLVMCDRFTKLTRVSPLKDITAVDVLSELLDVWVASYGIPDSILSDNGPQFASVLYQGVMKMLGVQTNFATPYHPQTNGQVERFNRTLVRQLRHYVHDHVVTWARYASLLVTAYNSQVHSSTGEAPFAFVCPRRLPSVAVERLTQTEGETSTQTPSQAKASLLQRLEEMIPLVRATMEKAQARYKRYFDVRVRHRRDPLRVGDWIYVNSHDNKGGKLVFKTLGPYHILKTDGRRLTIESDDGIRTINGNHATRAPEPPEGDPAWERALQAWKVPSLPTSSNKPLEAVFDKFVGHGYDESGRLMLRVRWFGYGPTSDTWEFVEDLPVEKVRRYCQTVGISIRRRSTRTSGDEVPAPSQSRAASQP